MKFGDTTFIGLVDTSAYPSFVHEDWTLPMLIKHFAAQRRARTALVFQMTNKGIPHSWQIDVRLHDSCAHTPCFRQAQGFIRVTNNHLYLVDYDCLTMAAQFDDTTVPDKNCSKNKIDIENGLYQVDVVQFYNADTKEHTGANDCDMRLAFTPVAAIPDSPNEDTVFWQNVV